MKSNLPFSSSSNESKVFRLDGHEQLVLQDRLAGVERDVQPEKTVKRIKKCSTIVLKSPTRASSVQTSGDFTYKFAFRQAILLGPFRQQAKVATPIKIKGFGFKTPSI